MGFQAITSQYQCSALTTELSSQLGAYHIVYHSLIIRSDEGLTLETSALYSLRWPIYIFNLVDTTKLRCYPHRRSTTVSLETFTLNSFTNSRAESKRTPKEFLTSVDANALREFLLSRELF